MRNANAKHDSPNTTQVSGMEGKSFPIVAIGASAGGLETFSQFLKSLPNRTGMAFVFIQHLDPSHPSILSELLAKAASIPVSDAKNGMRVQPDRVYVMPPNAQMSILNGCLQLAPRITTHGQHLPIDFFMRSLAEQHKVLAIGVILSGTASDGTLGLAAIKAEGGITFAQDPETARYDGMPRSAVASGCVDFVLSVEDICKELTRISRHPYAEAATLEKPLSSESYEEIFTLLHKTHGADFRNYKAGTINRRTLRRMAVLKINRLNDYVKYLRTNPDENENLYQDLLIPVTSFFRDLEAFEILKTKVFPLVVKDKANKGNIRIWAPGCSTGEETYSLAITLLEFLGDKAASYEIQLFGTDVNERGIDKARAGVYLDGISQEVSPERLRRFFTKVDEGYRVTKAIRDLCVFARQNLISDPPFSQMNLVACRNVLIYLSPTLQRKIVPIFHYALKPSGFLMLGSSESAAGFSNLFATVDKKNRIFSKKAVASRVQYDFTTTRYPREIAATHQESQRGVPKIGADVHGEADRIVLNRYAPVGVIVNSEMEIIQFRGTVTPYIEPSPGRASLNLLKMARGGLLTELRAAISQAKRTGVSAKRRNVRFHHSGRNRSVTITVDTLYSRNQSPDKHYLVLFSEARPVAAVPAAPDGKGAKPVGKRDPRLAEAQRRITSTEEHLRSVIESKEAIEEEFQSANEEILSANEELQSTNEELETSKEELQSANEELNTVNDELHNRNIELEQIGNDLRNVLSSTNLPIVMVDRALCIRRFTPAAASAFKFIPTDVGRSISDIRSDIQVPDFEKSLTDVIDTLTPSEKDVQDKTGRWHSLQIRPYRTSDNKIDGAVILLSDITERKQIEALSTREHARLESLVVQRTEAIRQLSHRLMSVQDEEHRSLSRELHDSVGQHLASVKMTIDRLRRTGTEEKERELLAQASDALEACLRETRTISHLLHPPMIDELGFFSAAKWFAEGFAERSGIRVNAKFPPNAARLPLAIELPLFRVLQASLSNVHRHSQSHSVEIQGALQDREVVLEVRDHGRGIGPEMLERVNATGGSGVGIGIAGMRERIRELGGRLEIESDKNGTTIRAIMPLDNEGAEGVP